MNYLFNRAYNEPIFNNASIDNNNQDAEYSFSLILFNSTNIHNNFLFNITNTSKLFWDSKNNIIAVDKFLSLIPQGVFKYISKWLFTSGLSSFHLASLFIHVKVVYLFLRKGENVFLFNGNRNHLLKRMDKNCLVFIWFDQYERIVCLFKYKYKNHMTMEVFVDKWQQTGHCYLIHMVDIEIS